jgi:hypothetical protein
MDDAFKIKTYIPDGFVKVCDVAEDDDGMWYYTSIDDAVMFDPHRSWIYAIVTREFLDIEQGTIDPDPGVVEKLGESGNPLGIRCQRGDKTQPAKSTQSRLGRYRNGDGTDERIRAELHNEVAAGLVSIWARKCMLIPIDVTIAGTNAQTALSFHKDVELRYLEHIFNTTGKLPRLNKSIK